MIWHRSLIIVLYFKYLPAVFLCQIYKRYNHCFHKILEYWVVICPWAPMCPTCEHLCAPSMIEATHGPQAICGKQGALKSVSCCNGQLALLVVLPFRGALTELNIPVGNLCHVVWMEINLFSLQSLSQRCHEPKLGQSESSEFFLHFKGSLIYSNSLTKLRGYGLGVAGSHFY